MEKKRYNDVFIIKETEVLVDGFLFRKRNGIYFYCVNCHIGIKLLKSDHGYEAITTNKQSTTIDHKLSMHKAHTIEEAFINSKSDVISCYFRRKAGYETNRHPEYANQTIAMEKGFAHMNPSQISRAKWNYSISFNLPKTYQDSSKMNICIAFKEDCFYIYGKPSSLYLLASSHLFLEDGTFGIVNSNGQLFILHCQIGNKYVSALYVKMKTRLEEDYLQVFNTINQLGKERNINIFDRSIVIKGDFEPSVISMIRKSFPTLTFSGCLYHFSHCIINNVKTNNLQKHYRLPSFRTLIKRIYFMALLPRDLCSVAALNYIFKRFYGDKGSTEYFISQEDSFIKFKQYITKTWFKSPYVVKMWNVSEQNCRTNNISESSHSVMKYNHNVHNTVSALIYTINKMLERDKNNILGIKLIESPNKDYENEKNDLIRILFSKFEGDQIFFIDYLDEIIKIFNCKNRDQLLDIYQKYTVTYFTKLLAKWKGRHKNDNYRIAVGRNTDEKETNISGNSLITTAEVALNEKTISIDNMTYAATPNDNISLIGVTIKEASKGERDLGIKLSTSKVTLQELFQYDKGDEMKLEEPVNVSSYYNRFEANKKELHLVERESIRKSVEPVKEKESKDNTKKLNKENAEDYEEHEVIDLCLNDEDIDDEMNKYMDIFGTGLTDDIYFRTLKDLYNSKTKLNMNVIEGYLKIIERKSQDCMNDVLKLCDPSIIQMIIRVLTNKGNIDSNLKPINNNLFGHDKIGGVNDDYKFVIIPCCYEGHWVLLEWIKNTKDEKLNDNIFIINSYCDNDLTVLKNQILEYIRYKTNAIIPNFVDLNCYKQTDDWSCGYRVICSIHDLIENRWFMNPFNIQTTIRKTLNKK